MIETIEKTMRYVIPIIGFIFAMYLTSLCLFGECLYCCVTTGISTNCLFAFMWWMFALATSGINIFLLRDKNEQKRM